MVKPRVSKLLDKYYGNFVNGTTMFKNIVRSHLTENSVVLDIGAGDGTGFRNDFRGKGRRVVGLDVVDSIAENPFLDEWVKADICNTPFDDCRFDVAYSTYVFEHIKEPKAMVSEIYRILKPGGFVIIRTPNIWHYTTFISRHTPHRLHTILRSRLQDIHETSVFPTFYRINTRRKMVNIFESCNFETRSIQMIERQPSYLTWSVPTFLLGVLYERIVNRFDLLSCFRANILAVFRKPIR